MAQTQNFMHLNGYIELFNRSKYLCAFMLYLYYGVVEQRLTGYQLR